MRRSGFATVIALTLLAMIAVALSAIAIALHAEAKRTRSVQIRAELQQLLLAAGSDLKQRSEHWPAVVLPADWSLELPSEFATDTQVAAHVSPDGPTAATVEITARIARQQLPQVIHLQRDQTGWHIQEARLN